MKAKYRICETYKQCQVEERGCAMRDNNNNNNNNNNTRVKKSQLACCFLFIIFRSINTIFFLYSIDVFCFYFKIIISIIKICAY